MALGFAGLGVVGYRGARKRRTASGGLPQTAF
jgi:hypothetical protein